ncbi:hypothetical protein P879_03190 [Paragonimus westermani]|uniref:Uncharacterized protein n=1 Tax=Paragonimus westermani TaxID=34504 RepID=A0A8T0DQU1_9TREM|nr:hypothetical protein P879_03190 [Paragonimus westermani]
MIQRKSSVCLSINESNGITLPNYIPYNHSSTKWLLNTFRNGASNRLIAMLKERPHLFRQIFQIFDTPSEVLADPTDTKCMFNNATILYLRPLSLAVYMRCKTAVQVLLSSTLCSPMEYSYASDVHVQLQGHYGGDLLELLPACIAIRRQFLEILPSLFQLTTCSPRTPFTTRYLSKRVQRTAVYDDVFHYATDIAQTNRHINIVKTLEVLIRQCPGFHTPGKLDEKKRSQSYSLFRRLAYIALYEDTEGRISSPLIQCMELLVRNSHFQPNSSTSGRNAITHLLLLSFKDVHKNWSELNNWTRDCYVCAMLLFQLHVTLVQKTKTTIVGQASNLLFRVLCQTNLLNSVVAMSLEDLAAALEFIRRNDTVGRNLSYDPKIHVSSTVYSDERGDENLVMDCRKTKERHNTVTPFGTMLDALAQLVDNLRIRSKLAHTKQMHLLYLAGTNRPALSRIQLPKYRSTFSRTNASFITSPTEKDSRSFSNCQYPECLCRVRKYKYPFVHGGLTETETERLLSSRSQTRKTSQSRENSRQLIASGSSYLPIVEIISSPTQPSASVANVSGLKSNRGDGLNTGPQPVSYNQNSKLEELAQSKPNTTMSSGQSSGVSSVEGPIEAAGKSASTVIVESHQQTAGESELHQLEAPTQNQINVHEKVERYKREKCRKAVSALIVKKPSVENLSLRDVDQLIDCITTSALLANEKELDSQLIEELFRDYMDQGLFQSRVVSRANSVIGTQVYYEHGEATNAGNADLRSNVAETTIATSKGEQLSHTTNLLIKDKPDFCGTNEILPTQSCVQNETETNATLVSVQPVESVPSSELDSSTNYGKFLWSCAKPISQINNAIGALKQHMSVNKRTYARLAQKTNPFRSENMNLKF